MPSAYKFANDQIFIDKLNLKCVCGPNAFGKLKPQQVSLSVKLGTSIARAAAHDRVDLSVDYSALAKDLIALEEFKFESVVELLEKVTVLGVEKYGVSKLCVQAQVEKEVLQAKNTVLERTAWVDDGVKGDWKYRVEEIEIPIIIGIKENVHERTHKQRVCIDLEWYASDQRSVVANSQRMNDMVNCIVEVYSLVPIELMSRKYHRHHTNHSNPLLH
jgi:FolB domain-containing protein